MPFIGQQPTTGAFLELDSLTASPTANYDLQLNGAYYYPESVNNLLVSINGVIQGSNTLSLSGYTLTVGATLSSSDTIDFVRVFGNVGTISTPTDGSVTASKIASGAVTNAKIADSTLDLTSKVTGTLPVANGGTGLSSGFVNGITGLDQFRLTEDTTNGFNGDITSDIERVDDATFAKIGTGMTESSGIFSFPETGLWQVICNPGVIGVSDNRNSVVTNVSSDSGSNYDEVADASGGGGASSFDLNNVYSNAFVNVTNASTFRVKFTAISFGVSCRLVGDTNKTRTSFSFIRLGGSQ